MCAATMQGTFATLVLCLAYNHVLAAAPTFSIPSSAGQSIPVSEDVTPGSSVYALLGFDPEGQSVSFSIKSQNPSSPAFSIDVNDVLAPSTELDAETTQSFEFVFTISDGTSSTDSPSFTINIEDVNEYSPEFVGAPYFESIEDSADAGTSVVTVSATDQDVTADLTYTLTSGNTPSTFAINGNTGAITVRNVSNLNFTRTSSYNLTVQVSDNSNIVSTTVHIAVIGTSPNGAMSSGLITAWLTKVIMLLWLLRTMV